MDVLVVGSGGREHELARQLARSHEVKTVYVAPGNAGTQRLAGVQNIPLAADDVPGIVTFVKDKQIAVVVIGPEAPLMAGLSDALRAENVAVFGPSKQAAQLESSKAFAAEFMERHDIPQPARWVAHTLDEARRIITDKSPESYVLKADGLAGGKGVVLPATAEEAQAALEDMFSGAGYDGAGKDAVVIQERLHGPEVSAFAVSDGQHFVLLPFAQDHKRLKDHDQGPNTGGMGAYAPVPARIVSAKQAAAITTIAQKSINGMAADDTPYQGVLYIGLMLAEERGGDPVVIEYNARFGDPETQVVLAALEAAGCDVADLLVRAARGDVSDVTLPEASAAALTVCLAAAGYPEHPLKGDPISGLEAQYPDVIMHYAGVKQSGDNLETAGGRVLYVTGTGATVDEAAARAYAAIGAKGVHFSGMQYRQDIGYQARAKSGLHA